VIADTCDLLPAGLQLQQRLVLADPVTSCASRVGKLLDTLCHPIRHRPLHPTAGGRCNDSSSQSGFRQKADGVIDGTLVWLEAGTASTLTNKVLDTCAKRSGRPSARNCSQE
jgi:hypothetical protein